MRTEGNCGNGEQPAEHEPRGTHLRRGDSGEVIYWHAVAWHHSPKRLAAAAVLSDREGTP